MPPIRRYLRISKYSVLESRIYLENPSDTRWLLNSRDPVLPRIFAAIRPLVLPKLREENERLFARKKGHPVKDVIVEDDFEVSLFLRETRTRHSLLTRHKTIEDPNQEANTNENQKDDNTAETGILVESDDDDDDDQDTHLHDIPAADESTTAESPASASEAAAAPNERRKKKKQTQTQDEKKFRFRTSYESFNIHGWVLCLLVSRKAVSVSAEAEPKGQVLMEEWMSTQAQAQGADE